MSIFYISRNRILFLFRVRFEPLFTPHKNATATRRDLRAWRNSSIADVYLGTNPAWSVRSVDRLVTPSVRRRTWFTLLLYQVHGGRQTREYVRAPSGTEHGNCRVGVGGSTTRDSWLYATTPNRSLSDTIAATVLAACLTMSRTVVLRTFISLMTSREAIDPETSITARSRTGTRTPVAGTTTTPFSGADEAMGTTGAGTGSAATTGVGTGSGRRARLGIARHRARGVGLEPAHDRLALVRVASGRDHRVHERLVRAGPVVGGKCGLNPKTTVRFTRNPGKPWRCEGRPWCSTPLSAPAPRVAGDTASGSKKCMR